MAEASLIPKKVQPHGLYPAEGLGAFFMIAFIIFLSSACLTGALYVYKSFLSSNLEQQKSVLKKLEVEFEPTLIARLENVSNSIKAAREILRDHTNTSKFFDLLEKNTLTTVGFSHFSYSFDKSSVTLNGEAASYANVSNQANVFEALDEVESATFSNLSLRDIGTVGFTLNIVFKK